jgi:hypothetical protein
MRFVSSDEAACLREPMRQERSTGFPVWTVFAISTAIFIAAALVYFFSARSPTPVPPVFVISVCRPLAAGRRRIGSNRTIQFDIPESGFKVSSEMYDMPPGQWLFGIRLKDGTANLEMSDGKIPSARELESALPVFSEHVEKRDIYGSQGNRIGDDRWGYLKSGERWRYIKFVWGDEVGYRATRIDKAKVLDQVITSACVLPDGPP